MEFVDVFSGAGGLSLGLERAGLRCVEAVEIDRDACDTFSASHPRAKLIDTSVEDINFKSRGGIFLIAGGPPCQPFSSGGKGLAADDGRDMIPAFVKAVREAKPRAFLLENVPGLISQTHSAYFDAALRELRALDYEVTADILNAAEYGVPQKRRRLIVVGMRGTGHPFVFPKPTHGPRGRKPFVPVSEVVSMFKILGEPNESKVVYAKNPDLRPSPYDGHLFNGGGRPIDPLAPSHTILASAGGNKTHFIDATREVPAYHRELKSGGQPRVGTLAGGRRLTVPESAAVQTFPAGMKFAGSRSSQYKQIGNAVPPVLAAVVGGAIVNHLARNAG